MSITWKVFNTIQDNKGNSGDNQIVKVEIGVGYTVDDLTAWRKFKVDMPDTAGSFTPIDDITESQIITWVKAVIESLNHPTIEWCEQKAKEEYDRAKARQNRELNQNVKSWE